jgi:hypothetical protein
MALVLADRVRETTTTAGTGTITLLGAVPSCQSFAVVGDGNTTYYTIVAYSGTEWEVGIGTYTSSGTTLSRDTVLSSSNSGSLVNFSAGTKDVFVDYPAGRAVYENAAGNVDGYPITGGTINNTVIGGTTPAAGTFTTLTATGQTSLGGAAGAESLRVVPVASSVNYISAYGSSSTNPYLVSEGAGANLHLSLSNKGNSTSFGIRFFTNNLAQEQMRVSHTASAVNYVNITGAATGNAPSVIAAGSDASMNFALSSKGTGSLYFYTNSANANSRQLDITHNGSVVNRFQLTGANTGSGVVLGVNGSDTNISQVFQSKGTGAIDLAAGSSGVNISNGGTVTAITRTFSGSGYTSFPTIAITAPTTAGGVQAVLAIPSMTNTAATVQAGGTGYTVGNVLTVVGGTGGTCTVPVTAVSGGVVTAVGTPNFAQFTVLPTNPVSTTGGTGSGCTLNLTYGVTAPTITNAGSGYVEQPTVTFSGGGGSGAAAYATVGAGSVIRSLGQTGTSSLSFFTPSGEVLRIRDTGSVGAYSMFSNTAAGTTLVTQGAANAFASFNSNGTGSILFGTNGNSGNTQMVVSHTASAVNYVQVTGSATGGRPTISSQGSDTNIDLALTPKGTGNVRFGTYTANMALTVQGYIEIKDSGGTVRRLAVIA